MHFKEAIRPLEGLKKYCWDLGLAEKGLLEAVA